MNSLAIFGSAARDDLQAESDVDLLVEFSEPIGLFHFARTQHKLEEVLGMQVDLVHRDALRPEFQSRVLEELVDV